VNHCRLVVVVVVDRTAALFQIYTPHSPLYKPAISHSDLNIPTAASVNITAFWYIVPCSLGVDRRFRGTTAFIIRAMNDEFTEQYIKVKQSRYTPWRRLGGEEV
jgi:hypothetical protein